MVSIVALMSDSVFGSVWPGIFRAGGLPPHAYHLSIQTRGPYIMKTAFQWDDAFRLDDQLSDDERAVRDAAHQYCQERLQTRVLMAARHEKFDREIMNELGALGMLGST